LQNADTHEKIERTFGYKTRKTNALISGFSGHCISFPDRIVGTVKMQEIKNIMGKK
jgi:hypothetical protein